MTYLYIVPKWFFGFGIGMEFLFAIATLIVALYSFAIYRLSLQRESKWFGIGFLMIAISYFIKAILNSFLLNEIKEGLRGIALEELNMIGLIGAYSHIILFTIGLVTLAYTTFKFPSWRLYILLIVTSLLTITISYNKVLAFHLVSGLFLLFISVYYINEYVKNKNSKTALVMLSFVLLFLSGLDIDSINFYSAFVISHFIEFGAYLLIMISLFLTIRKRPLKR
ncbi:MAG: hypothetical protein Q7S74_03325 [Nanoarchaeota archaeon]|nr:hypothetical protein [Nanoarchaeota archaeon]